MDVHDLSGEGGELTINDRMISDACAPSSRTLLCLRKYLCWIQIQNVDEKVMLKVV